MVARQHLACSGDVVTYESVAHIEARDQLKETLRSLIADDMRAALMPVESDDAALRRAIETRLSQILDHEDALLSATDRAEIISDVTETILS